jgi:hypothetical protein
VTHVNRLLHNNGDGTFSHLFTTPVTDTVDAYTIPTWSDYDLDGDIDLFIGSGEITQLDEDNLYENQLTQGSPLEFIKLTTAPIATDLLDGQVWNWIDYDNDRDLDGFITNYNGGLANKLYRNDAGTYVTMTGADVGSIVTDSNQGLGNLWADFDNDGDLDCLITNDNAPTNDYFVNDGDGTFTQNFVEPFVTSPGPHYGSTAGDYDNDGDLDLYIHGSTTSKGLYRNDLANGNGWLNVKLVGAGAPGGSNISALGAKVEAKATIGGTAVWQFREISAQNSFSSMNMLNAHFGLGNATVIDTLVVTWPSGIVQVLDNVTPNQFLVVNETVGPTDASLVGNPSRSEIVLGRAVPNPTRAGASIDFEIAREQSVTLALFDIAGRHVRTLADGAFAAGRHQVGWDGRDEAGRAVSSGVYFYRLRAASSSVEISDRLVLRR